MKNTTIFKTSNFGKNLRFWHFCLILYALLSVTGVRAQTTVSLGTGTTTSTGDTTGAGLGPVNAYYEYLHYQVVYTAAEITAGGGAAGVITQFGWNVSTASPLLPNYKIRMGQTSATDSAAHNTATLTEVYSANFTPTTGYNMFTLSTGFFWDGTSNILIDVCYGAAAFTSPYGQVFTYGTAANSSRFSRADGANQCGVNTNYINAWKPQARFVISPPPSCLPVSGLAVTGITANGATANWTAPTAVPALGYDYYLTTTNTAPTSGSTPTGNVASGTTLTLSALTANSNYYMWIRGKCSASDMSTWSAVVAFNTPCDPQNVPYTQDFESVTTPALPTCTSVQTLSGNTWATNSPADYGFNNKALRYAYNTASAANSWFFTKGLNLTAGTSYRITYKYGSAGSNEKMKVAYGTSPSAAAMTLPLADHNGFSTSPLNNTVDFVPATTGIYYFGFNAYSNANLFWLFLDDISITLSPSCLSPTALTSSNVATTSATISWTAPATAPADGYQYYTSTTNTAPTSGTTPTGSVAAGVLTVPLSGLTPNTPYYVWVRGNCGAGGTSAWSTVVSFTTPCDPQNVPYTQDFESVTTPALPQCTSVQTLSGNTWTTNSPAGYGFNNKALRYQYNTATAANSWFFTKGLNLTAGTSYRITYKYGSAGFNERMKVAYGTSASAAAMTLPLADHNGFTTSPLNNTVDFTPPTTGVYYFGFNAYSAADLFWIFVDDINITLTPTCLAPTALTSATVSTTSGTISWTAPSTAPANGYQYYTSTTNTAPTGATTPTGSVAAGTTTATLSGLAPNTTNYVWVRSNCTASDQSTWTGPTSFFTGYCTPAPTSVDGTGITNVNMGTINNATVAEAGNYGNYSAMSFNATLGSTVNFTIGYGTCVAGTCYDYNTNIWVDWNNDLDFTDAGELVFTGNSTATNPVTLTGSFNVPANALFAGSHRIRIGAADAGAPAPCYTGTWAAFEDYTINAVMPPAPVITSFTPSSYCAATGVITITGTDLGNATVTIGGTAVTPLTTNTVTQIVATVPAGVSGTVTVTTIGGTNTSTGTFSVTAPTAIVLSGSSDAICVGETSDTVTITSGAAAFDTFTWSPLTGVSGTAAAGYTFNPTATTTYTLTASNAGSGCVTTATFTVNVNVLPTALVLPDSAAVCEGGSAVAIAATGATTLNTLLSQNFNAATNDWTTANNGTGGTVAAAAWTLRPNGYLIPGYNVVNSNDNTQYYLSNSDSQGSGSNTSVILQTPAFSTVAYSSVNLSFYHFYMQWQTSTAKVEASVDGTAWTTLQTYNANVGTYTAFATANIPLTAPFLNQPTVYLRFKFDAPWGYFWGIDNVNITGQQGANITWAPQAGLYTDAAATTAYTGQAAATVYAKPTATTTYTATATNPSGCVVMDAVEVTYTNTLAPTAAATQALCSGATVSGLTATGAVVKWYAAPTGGNELTGTTALVDGMTYYASQVANGCESPTRTAVTVDIIVTAPPTVANDIQTFCNAGTVSQLVVTGTAVQWYTSATGGTAVAGTTAFTEGTTIYYASQTLNGCESMSRTAVAVILSATDAPEAAASQTFCNTGTVAGLMATGTGLQWYSEATGGTALAGTTEVTNGGVYYASQTVGGCESATRTMVTATISTPAAPTAEAAQTFCNSATVADLNATGTAGAAIAWYSAETGGTPLTGSTMLTNGTMYYASQAVEGCESAARTMVTATVSMTAAPIVAVTLQSFCDSATVADLEAEGTGVLWYTSSTGGTAMASDAALTNGMVYYASQTVDGCESMQRTVVAVSIGTVATLTGDAEQTVTVGDADDATIEDLMVSGYVGYITWYATEEDALGGDDPLAAGTQLVSGETYYAIQTVGECRGTTAFAVTVDVALGNEHFDLASFKYYPNPVRDVLNVSYTSDISSISMFNLLGQQVLLLEPGTTEAKIDMSSLADGAYIMKVTAGNAVKTIKIMKKQ